MAEGLTNAIALGNERIERIKKFQGQSAYPLFDWVMRQPKTHLDDFGLRLPVYLAEPGGETFFTYAAPDFRAPIAPEDDAMRVYPARSAVAIALNGDMLRKLKRGEDSAFLKYQERIDRTAMSLKKILSRHFHGDGTGAIGIASSAHGATGVVTLTGQFVGGGTSAQASTKGTSNMKKNEIYDFINPATEAVRGTGTVLTEGRRSVSLNLTAGTIAIGDKIVQSGSWKKVPVGLRNLVGFANRIVQNFDTATAPNMNSPVYDLNGAATSPSAFSVAKGLVQTYLNDGMEEKGKIVVMTYGHQKTLVNQAFQYRQYVNPKGDETVYGVASKYVDSDGDIHFLDADAPDDQIRIIDANTLSVGEDMPWGVYNDDGNEWRMRPGAFSSGSDIWVLSMGWQGQLKKAGVMMADAIIDDVAHSGSDYVTQASV